MRKSKLYRTPELCGPEERRVLIGSSDKLTEVCSGAGVEMSILKRSHSWEASIIDGDAAEQRQIRQLITKDQDFIKDFRL